MLDRQVTIKLYGGFPFLAFELDFLEVFTAFLLSVKPVLYHLDFYLV